jgi:hypothetical protein
MRFCDQFPGFTFQIDVNHPRCRKMLVPSDRPLSASPGGSNMLLTADEPKKNCERNRLPECCLLSGILGVGWPFPFHATQSERRMVECRGRRGRAVLVVNVLDFGIIARPAFRGVGGKSMDIGGNSGPCFVCGRSAHDFVDSLVSRCMTQRVAHISIANVTMGARGLVSET